MPSAFSGPKLRQLRLEKGLTQTSLAERLDVSPSYLNLIEHNRRKVTAKIANRISEIFNLDLEFLSGRDEAFLLGQLQEVLGDGIFSGLDLDGLRLQELVAREPQLCAAVVHLYRAYGRARGETRGLAELLANDPEFAQSSHRLLTILTSLRSFAEILRDNADLAEERKTQFARIVVEESEKLTAELRQHFESFSHGRFGPTLALDLPREEVSEILQTRNNYFHELEERAEAFRAQFLPDWEGEALALRPLVYLAEDRFGLVVDSEGQESRQTREPTVRRLSLPASLSTPSRVFRILRELARLYLSGEIERLVVEARFTHESAGQLYRAALEGYFAGAVMMPYRALRDAAEGLRHDLEALQTRFAVSFEQLCHRLTTLQRPGDEGVAFHFLRSDIAGNIDKRFTASGVTLPRFGGVCPLWNIHSAFLQRGRITTQLAEFPDGRRIVMLARTVEKPKARFHDPDRVLSVAIGCDVSFAARLIYAQGLERERAQSIPVGGSCRYCTRTSCGHRVFPLLRERGQDRPVQAGGTKGEVTEEPLEG